MNLRSISAPTLRLLFFDLEDHESETGIKSQLQMHSAYCTCFVKLTFIVVKTSSKSDIASVLSETTTYMNFQKLGYQFNL